MYRVMVFLGLLGMGIQVEAKKIRDIKMIKIGHRGASGVELENSIAAFEKAIELGVDMIELDVIPCKSGEVIVMHDNTIDRTTNGSGTVADMTFDELQQYALNNGEPIPTLERVLKAVDRRCKVNVELKVGGDDTSLKVIAVLKKFIDDGWEADDFLVSSFDHYLLLPFLEQMPNVLRAPIIASIPIGYAEFATKSEAYSVNVKLDMTTQEFIDDAHARGFKFFVWTVNSKDEIQKCIDMGVDGVFTDHSKLFDEIR